MDTFHSCTVPFLVSNLYFLAGILTRCLRKKIHPRTLFSESEFFYASNEPKSVLARDLGDCRDNYEKLAKRVSCSFMP